VGGGPIPPGDRGRSRTNDHHTLCMTFDEMNAVVGHGPHIASGDGALPATAGIKNALNAGLRHDRACTFIGCRDT